MGLMIPAETGHAIGKGAPLAKWGADPLVFDGKEYLGLEKNEKVKAVEDMRERLSRSNAAFIAEYKGIKAGEMNEMRRSLRESSVELKIVRNTLAERAVKDTNFASLAGSFAGAVAIAFSYKDAALAAKALVQFAKEQPNLRLRLAAAGGRVLTVDEIKMLAEMPPREVLLGKLVGLLKAPSAGLVGVLSGVPRKLVYALSALQKTRQQ
jgi:large subunit ribosomal protein L10